MMITLVFVTLLAGQAPPPPTLLDLPVLGRDGRHLQKSSFDRSGGNDDGFSQTHSVLYVDPALGHVVFDATGPGVLVRLCFPFWSSMFTSATTENYNLRFWFDDETAPRHDLPVRDLFSGNHPPFSGPLVSSDSVNPGAGIAYVWLPFQSRLRIAATAAPYFHEIGWMEGAPPGPPNLDPLAEKKASTRTFALAPGASAVMKGPEGPGTIVRFDIDPSVRTDAVLRNLRVRITFDGETVPQVDAPLGLLFGSAYTESVVDSIAMKMGPGAPYRLLFPMPYDSSASISFHNGSAAPVGLAVGLGWIPDLPAGPWGHFHVTASSSLPTSFGVDHPILERDGAGKVVAVVLAPEVRLDIPQQGIPWPPSTPEETNRLVRHMLSHLEGDLRVFVDGSDTPAAHGTGTETYFNWGWYDAPFDVPFALPMHGCSGRFLELDPIALRRSFHRLHLYDPMTFRRSIRIGIEHGPVNNVDADYRSAAFYYARADAALGAGDSFDAGDERSESDHDYRSPGSAPAAELDATYEGLSDPVTVNDTGRLLEGRAEFRMALDPSNVGAVLRARVDAELGAGPVRVFVDDVPVGPWQDLAPNAWNRWRDLDLELPVTATAGKSSILIRIEGTGRGAWTGFRYDLWPILDSGTMDGFGRTGAFGSSGRCSQSSAAGPSAAFLLAAVLPGRRNRQRKDQPSRARA